LIKGRFLNLNKMNAKYPTEALQNRKIGRSILNAFIICSCFLTIDVYSLM
jgi:hypothetical protein